jgi:hypothetical protein
VSKTFRLPVAALALTGALAVATFSPAAQAALVSTDGGLGVYDTTNNVTWTSDANLFATQAASYGGGAAALVNTIIADSGGVIHDTVSLLDPSGTHTLTALDFVTSTGQMDWWGAQAWVHYLDVTNYGGSNQWALPTTVDADSSQGFPNGSRAAGYAAQSSSQMAQLFYGGLGQVVNGPITTFHNSNYGLFSNLQNSAYWSGTEYSTQPALAWYFDTGDGYQDHYIFNDNGSKNSAGYALAVSPGQVSAVPLPGAAWLLGSGLLGLMGLGRRKAETLALRSFG